MSQKRLARVDRELCNPKVSGYACKKFCPVNRSGDDCITISPEDQKIFIDEALCIGCGICVRKCPKNAIQVVNLPQELEGNPIHRYGKNEFSLYRLPVPKQNAVIGLIGPNGTGKSTILNILSSRLRPNTGSIGVEIPWEEVIGRFRGTELQGYLEKLSAGGIKTAYKPQKVDLIPKIWKGGVRALLEKTSEAGDIDKVVKRLGIGEMLGKDVASLSGGELQLLAVAACILKKADFYFFDEPSSYLDAFERLEVAKVIRELSRKAVVMVVEHDLAVADYLADYTHILYGKPGVFGVVSKPYVVRTGINTYLEGYIKEENMRFREEAITFSQRAKPAEKDKLFRSFPGYEKRFKGFSMKTEPGNLYRGEIIGILGPNGTGKTTLMKMLIGEVKPDKGEALEGIGLSYKPQRLVLSGKEEGMMVQEFISKRSGESISRKENKRVLAFLGIENLLEREIGNLSGGELQSVMVASALIKKHDILFLDEPSAFLDVEQRLRVARLLRDHAEGLEIPVFVIDHDLQFIDVVSDRVIVFEGMRGVLGKANSPSRLEDGMNSFLRALGVTFRRDPETGRPRANKPDSQKDNEQKRSRKFYYAG